MGSTLDDNAAASGADAAKTEKNDNKNEKKEGGGGGGDDSPKNNSTPEKNDEVLKRLSIPLSRYTSKHNYPGIIAGCTISYTMIDNDTKVAHTSSFDIDLLIDTGFSEDLCLPYEKCQQLGLKVHNIIRMTHPNGKSDDYAEYNKMVSLTIVMDDGTVINDFMTVLSCAPPFSVNMIYNDSSSGGEEKAPSTPQRPIVDIKATKQLSPVKFDEKMDHKTYALEQCLLGYNGLQRLKLRIDPANNRLILPRTRKAIVHPLVLPKNK